MKRKNLVSIVIIVIILLVGMVSLFVSRKNYSQANKNNALKVGFVLPITGEGAVYGESAHNAAALAVADLKKENILLDPVFEDDQLKGDMAASAAQKLISIDHASAVLTFGSGETLAICPIAKNSNTVLLTEASSPAITGCSNKTIRNYPSDIYQGKVLAEKAIAAGYKKVALMYIDNDYGTGLKNEFTKDYSGQIITESHKVGETDFRTQIAKLKSQNPEAIILISFPTEGVQFLTEAATLGITLPIIGSESIKDDSVATKVPKSMQDTLTVIAAAQYEGKEAVNFKTEYQQMYGNTPAAFADYVYDNTILLGRAFASCSSSNSQMLNDCITSHLKNTHSVGATGQISFDQNGDRLDKSYDTFVISGTMFVKK